MSKTVNEVIEEIRHRINETEELLNKYHSVPYHIGDRDFFIAKINTKKEVLQDILYWIELNDVVTQSESDPIITIHYFGKTTTKKVTLTKFMEKINLVLVGSWYFILKKNPNRAGKTYYHDCLLEKGDDVHIQYNHQPYISGSDWKLIWKSYLGTEPKIPWDYDES